MDIRYTVRGADSTASHRELPLFGWKGQMTRGYCSNVWCVESGTGR